MSGNGDIHVQLDGWNRYLRYDHRGARMGRIALGSDPSSQDWYFQTSNDLCWVVAYDDVFLVEDLKTVKRRISRRADGHWLASPGQAAVAPDGSVAVTAYYGSEKGVSLNTYSSSGDPLATFFLPPEMNARWRTPVFDGEHVFIPDGGHLFAFTRNGKPLAKLTHRTTGDRDNWSRPYLAANGREFWFVDRRELVVHRYAVPTFE